jgi:asparagine synthase (glutamine-hydrolysing)
MGVSLEPHARPRSFSLAFADDDISEHPYQRLMAAKLNAEHTEVLASPDEIADWLPEVIYHCECPIRESYNSASLLLSQAVHRDGMKVVLTGEGADELFAGYLGYKFDKMREHSRGKDRVWLSEEDQLRLRLWGNPNLVYERDFIAFALVKRRLYAKQLAAQLDSFAFVNHPLVNKERLEGRHILHQRSYLDFKLRLSDHLLGDHGDRMALANSVEARYPFLDLELIECARGVPPDLKLREFDEKYVLKRIASGRLPAEIVDREKFAFRAPTSPRLLRLRREWLEELLAPKRIAREGYFNPETVQRLRQQYAGDDFEVDLMFADDLLMVIITFGLFLEVFRLPSIA